MSQAGIINVAGSGTGPVETLTGNTGGAVPPTGGNINVVGDAVGVNVAGNPGTSTLTISLLNYVNLTVTTTNATPNTSMVIPLGAVPGSYTFDVNVSAYDITDTIGAGFSVFSSVRTTGAAAVLIDNSDLIANTEGAMSGANVIVAVSGNDAIIEVTGLAAKVIDWRAIVFYTFVS